MSRYRELLSAALPGVELPEVELVTAGQNSDVVFIGQDLAARFPRYEDGVRLLEWEAAILRALGPRLPLAIPGPVAVHGGEPGAAFLIYRRVPGVPLDADVLRSLDGENALDAVAVDLARFLRALHGIPIGELPLPPDEDDDWMARWERMYARLRDALFPLIDGPARAWAERHFATFLAGKRNRAVVPAPVHGDFGGSNILLDPETGRVAGVVDFGSVHLGDPAVDLAAASTIAPGFLRRFAPAYPGLAAALPRVSFYKGTFALQEALFGVEKGDAAALKAGLAGVPPPEDMLRV